MEGKYGAADVKESGCSVGDRSGRRGRGYEVCPACPHHCLLKEGQYGRCGARKNEDGRIICANYGMITSLALDPMEKKAAVPIFSREHGAVHRELRLQPVLFLLPESRDFHGGSGTGGLQ